MKEVSKTGHFTIDLPSSDAATALSGPGNSFLKKFESLTGVSLTIRGLQPVSYTHLTLPTKRIV